MWLGTSSRRDQTINAAACSQATTSWFPGSAWEREPYYAECDRYDKKTRRASGWHAGFESSEQAAKSNRRSLDVEVQHKLVRMRTEPNLVTFRVPLVVNPRLDQVLGEDITAEQLIVIFLQGR